MSVAALEKLKPAPSHVANPLRASADEFRSAMRHLAGGVAVITTGSGESRTGFTATSVSSLSAEPPTLLVCVNLSSSSWPTLEREGRFGVNLLSVDHGASADRFAGRGGEKGPARFAGASWSVAATGAPLLADAIASLDCELDEIIIRHSHAILIGGVAATVIHESVREPLLYWRSAYRVLASG